MLLTGELNGRPPAYLQGKSLNLACLYPRRKMQKKYVCNGKYYLLLFLFILSLKINDIEQWPIVDVDEDKKAKLSGRSFDATPDPSQMKAIKHIFNNPISIVQGPPGTGKSFIGLKVRRGDYQFFL